MLALEVKDQPGALHGVAEALARAGLNVDNISGFVANRRAVLVVELADVARARALFEKQGIPILGEQQMLSL